MFAIEKHAGAYLRAGKVFLQPYSRTTTGLLMSEEPVLVAEEVCPNLGRKVLDALSGSRSGLPHPTTWKGRTDSLIKAAGCRSYEHFADTAKCVSIRLADNRVEFLPTKNGGRRNRFLHLPQKAIYSASSEPELGEALRRAFSECE